MTVGELLERIDSDELTEWAALFQIQAAEREHAAKVAKSRGRR